MSFFQSGTGPAQPALSPETRADSPRQARLFGEFLKSLPALFFLRGRGRKAPAALANFDVWFSAYRRRLEEACGRQRKP